MTRSSAPVSVAVAALLLSAGARLAHAQHLPDLVTQDVLRVCSDPGNMPFSERKGGGFENKIAQIVADELKIKLRYYWLTQGPGFVRNTLGTGLCDLIIGTSGGDIVQATNPYYRSAYVLVARKGELPDLKRLDDPRLKDKQIGIIAGTPPSNRLSELKLVGERIHAYAPYAFGAERKHQTVAAEVIADLSEKKIDVAILWGPSAGWLAKQSGVPMDVVPLLQEPGRPPLTFRVSMGVRHNENDWKRSLNAVLRKRKADIEAVLREYEVPLLAEEDNKPLDAADE
ncbi:MULTISPECIES: rare earth element methanol dehydrogenase accessory protein XoxJ [Methylorubrum]|uniref:rare earth element methanol dehydrogenase accessory protein XoxJ n=1 Tax=Methylorubrum TaxID=2282523 RepID=UPI00209D5D3E|nr:MULTISPECIES: rare earth element methanol dehydrogenase accessory protein XoxJ [Methylorubrum]MCP1547755.1 quinoprotein dehydrogenase-associated probable ABC transporter substrate-binding protein [Methylorubrum zatmanii]MCP1555629.1 quinoprotein dehydrogenase-associated probable ABC transporter substrate-binding protein [Methylorubrum extorquens]MCP1578058.1 quinoprotein dehydrogenase-associated probable ABC transporter substrate-binding protein [Methylorubrum extorquens]